MPSVVVNDRDPDSRVLSSALARTRAQLVRHAMPPRRSRLAASRRRAIRDIRHNRCLCDVRMDLDPDMCIENSQVIARSPETVWKLLRSQIGLDASPASDNAKVQTLGLSDRVFMEQRVVEQNDSLMLLRTEMTRCSHLPWSGYRATLRVDGAAGEEMSTVSASCLVTPTAERRLVGRMVQSILALALQNLKAEAERA